MSSPPFDVARADRWFAVETNNLAWDLVEKPTRSAMELETLVHAAHAALWHWSRAGGPLNRLRGLVLLAKVHLLAGNADLAGHYAQLGLVLSAELAAQPEGGLMPFDRATAFGAAALAARAAGKGAEADRFAGEAAEIAAALDPEDRGVFERLFQ
jgi:hypothetical protein